MAQRVAKGKQINISMSSRDIEALRELCVELDMNMSEAVRHLIRVYRSKYEICLSPGRIFIGDKEVFHAES